MTAPVIPPLPEEGSRDWYAHYAAIDAAARAAATKDELAAVEFAFGVQGANGGGGAFVHQQAAPAATWTFAHPLGRLPTVGLYVGGELVDADVDATTTTLTVTFPAATTGAAVLT